MKILLWWCSIISLMKYSSPFIVPIYNASMLTLLVPRGTCSIDIDFSWDYTPDSLSAITLRPSPPSWTSSRVVRVWSREIYEMRNNEEMRNTRAVRSAASVIRMSVIYYLYNLCWAAFATVLTQLLLRAAGSHSCLSKQHCPVHSIWLHEKICHRCSKNNSNF